MMLADLVARLETRAIEADAQRATAPLGDTLRWVVAELATVNGNGSAGKGPATSGPDTLLTAQEVAARLHVAPRWLYRHAARLPFTVHLAARVVRFREAGLAAWLERRR